MKLPDWFELQDKLGAGDQLTALEDFIYHHEPGGGDDEKRFRDQLAAAIAEVTGKSCDSR